MKLDLESRVSRLESDARVQRKAMKIQIFLLAAGMALIAAWVLTGG
jgi:hypothetical protein